MLLCFQPYHTATILSWDSFSLQFCSLAFVQLRGGGGTSRMTWRRQLIYLELLSKTRFDVPASRLVQIETLYLLLGSTVKQDKVAYFYWWWWYCLLAGSTITSVHARMRLIIVHALHITHIHIDMIWLAWLGYHHLARSRIVGLSRLPASWDDLVRCDLLDRRRAVRAEQGLRDLGHVWMRGENVLMREKRCFDY